MLAPYLTHTFRRVARLLSSGHSERTPLSSYSVFALDTTCGWLSTSADDDPIHYSFQGSACAGRGMGRDVRLTCPSCRRSGHGGSRGVGPHGLRAGLAGQRGRAGPRRWTPVAAGGAPHAEARKWWLGELSRVANEQGLALTEVPITPSDLARVVELTASGSLTDRLARQAVEGVLAGRGHSGRGGRRRGLVVVSDDGALKPPSTRRSRPIPMLRRRCATARSPHPVRWSAPS